MGIINDFEGISASEEECGIQNNGKYFSATTSCKVCPYQGGICHTYDSL